MNAQQLSIRRVEATTFAAEVADWIEAEWGILPIVESLRDRSRCFLSEDTTLPITYGGLIADELIATISILNDDLPGYPEMNPWIGCLVVRPNWRRHGFGNQMLVHAEGTSVDLGYSTLYLFAEAPLDAYYRRRGWRDVKWAADHGQPVLIMRKSVDRRQTISTGPLLT